MDTHSLFSSASMWQTMANPKTEGGEDMSRDTDDLMVDTPIETVTERDRDPIEMIQSLLTEDSPAVGVLAYSTDDIDPQP